MGWNWSLNFGVIDRWHLSGFRSTNLQKIGVFFQKFWNLSRKFLKLNPESNWAKTVEVKIATSAKIFKFTILDDPSKDYDSYDMSHMIWVKPEMEVSAYESVLIVNVCYVALLCGNMQFILDWQLLRNYKITSNQSPEDGPIRTLLVVWYRKWNQTRNQSVKDGINRVKIGFRFRYELNQSSFRFSSSFRSDLFSISYFTTIVLRSRITN